MHLHVYVCVCMLGLVCAAFRYRSFVSVTVCFIECFQLVVIVSTNIDGVHELRIVELSVGECSFASRLAAILSIMATALADKALAQFLSTGQHKILVTAWEDIGVPQDRQRFRRFQG